MLALVSSVLIRARRLRREWRFLVMRQVARYVAGRTVASVLIAATRRRRRPAALIGEQGSLFPELVVDEAVSALRKDGLYIGLRLPPNTFREIKEYARVGTRYGEQNERLGFRREGKAAAEQHVGYPFAIARYFNTISECGAIRSITQDAKLWQIAAAYCGFPPAFLGVNMWWSYASKALSQTQRSQWAQKYHQDVDGYKFLKFFFYLVQVGREDGPHVCVKGSHVSKKLSHQFAIRRFSDSEIEEFYPPGDVSVIEGPAGYGFVEDTACFHKGAPPLSRDRLVLQIVFGAFDYGHASDVRDSSHLKLATEG